MTKSEARQGRLKLRQKAALTRGIDLKAAASKEIPELSMPSLRTCALI